MKKYFMVLATLIFVLGTSCEEKINIEKEKEAIKAVFEADKTAYFNQDFNAMGELWIKEPSSIKIFMSDKGLTKYEGWENINASQKKETEDNSWDRKQVKATFLNYNIDLIDDESASVVCETAWDGIFGADTLSLKQSRIVVLKKVDGKWKYSLHSIFNIPK
jgi:hypothetical protein